MSVEVLHPGDPRYPGAFSLLEDPPKQLYAQGDLSLLERTRVSIIGSRHPSEYGERVALEAAEALAAKGAVIVSGMALGLDARAHVGALRAGGGTIAVLGGGIDVDYPRTNRHLLAEVREKGLVLSEYEPGAEPLKHHFIERNRLIAALADILLVVEGRINGGTSNTAKWAGEAGITIFGVPGQIGEELSESPNSLIRDGAYIYTHPNDILLPLGLPVYQEQPKGKEDAKQRRARIRRMLAGLNGDELTLVDLIGRRAVHVDELAARSEVDVGALLATLGALELQGIITQLPGKHFKLAA
jgi:DNA processing protein